MPLKDISWGDFSVLLETFFNEYDRVYTFLGYEFTLWDVVFCSGMFLLMSEFVAIFVYRLIYNP